MLGSDHLRRDGEVLVEVLDVQFRSCGLSDAQTSAIIGGQDDGADLMGLESVAHTCPGRVDALAEQGLFDRDQQMIGKHTKKDMRVGAGFETVEDRPDGERRFHVAEGILGAGEQSVGAPELVA